MSPNQLTLTNLLKQALNFEVESSRLYLFARDKTQDSDLKKLLNNLCNEEENHFFIILKIFNQTVGGSKVFTYTNKDREKAIQNINKKIKNAGLSNMSTFKDIIKFAIKEEKDAQEFYSNYLKNNKGTIKKILKKLIHEEKSHEAFLNELL